jgi:hypothetical protein
VTAWTDGRDEWIARSSAEELLAVIAEVVRRYGKTDETMGDVAETRESVLWLATRGQAPGVKEWGHAGVAAEELGLWSGG